MSTRLQITVLSIRLGHFRNYTHATRHLLLVKFLLTLLCLSSLPLLNTHPRYPTPRRPAEQHPYQGSNRKRKQQTLVKLRVWLDAKSNPFASSSICATHRSVPWWSPTWPVADKEKFPLPRTFFFPPWGPSHSLHHSYLPKPPDSNFPSPTPSPSYHHLV